LEAVTLIVHLYSWVAKSRVVRL